MKVGKAGHLGNTVADGQDTGGFHGVDLGCDAVERLAKRGEDIIGITVERAHAVS